MIIQRQALQPAALVWSRMQLSPVVSLFSISAMWWCQVAPKAKERVLHAALTPATKVFTSLDSCSACFDTSDAADKT